MRRLLSLLVIITAMSLTTFADEVTVGAAPDPYQVIWETATERDIDVLSQVVWYESARACCPMETNIAVVETVLNRCLSNEFPATIAAVCTQRGQFYRFDTKIDSEAVSEAIKSVRDNGMTVLPSTEYMYFATKMQSLGRDHIWLGGRTTTGKPFKGFGMYFCRGK